MLWHNDIGYWRDLKDSTINHFGWLEGDIQGSYNERYARYPLFIDNNYKLDDFLGGRYEIGPAADLNKLNQIYEFEIFKNLRTKCNKNKKVNLHT